MAKYKPYHARRTEEGTPSGYIIGRWFVGNAILERNSWIIVLYCSEAFYNSFNDAENTVVADTKVVVVPTTTKRVFPQHWGSYGNVYIANVLVNILKPLGDQEACYQHIKSVYNKKDYAVIWIYGQSGTGKSMIANYVAQQMGGPLCTTYKPWCSMHEFGKLLIESDYSKDRPLVILIDEVDKILDAIIYEQPLKEPRKGQREWMCDKYTWNKYWDDVNGRPDKNFIFIITSNQHQSVYDNYDPSLLRRGRMCSRITMKTKIDLDQGTPFDVDV
jgi:Cdc6-like AAA superfamily ATPase